VNDEVIPDATGHQFTYDRLKRGDRVRVEITPFDGTNEGAPYQTSAVVENTLPSVFKLTIEPSQIRLGDVLRARVEATDPDHDEIQFQFRWWKNGRVISDGEEPTFDTVGLLRDDSIAVSVVPHDGLGVGKETFSEAITIVNKPPKITSVPQPAVDAGRYQYLVIAEDPEGDPISFSLQTAPPGMTIDQRTGRIDWQIPGESKGSFRVKAVVQDDRGGWAFQEFDLTVSNPQAT
jgi:hypothetical protein